MKEKFITFGDQGEYFLVGLTFEGWERYDEIKRIGSPTRKVFMAMQFGDDKLNTLYENHLKEAVKQTGFELFKLDEVLAAGLIDNQLRVQIRNSRFVIADLTHDNHGAYWEAGYAEGLGKPVIYLCENTKFDEVKTHFDTNHHTTIIWDYDNPKDTINKLKATIRETIPAEAIMTDE